MSVYISPCDPCDYNYYEVDEFGDCKKDVCNCPKDKLKDDCWIERWAKELNDKRFYDKTNVFVSLYPFISDDIFYELSNYDTLSCHIFDSRYRVYDNFLLPDFLDFISSLYLSDQNIRIVSFNDHPYSFEGFASFRSVHFFIFYFSDVPVGYICCY